jgi:hypothetical protein
MSDRMPLQESIERVETQNSIDRICDCDECVEARRTVLEAAKAWCKVKDWTAERLKNTQNVHDAVETGDETGVF